MNADLVVIGLGAMGSATAWQAAARGLRVIGFDRHRPPHQLGSSGGRSRIIRQAYFEAPFYVPLVQRAYALWGELEGQQGQRLLHPTGGLVVGPPDGALVTGAVVSAEAHGVPYERMDAGEAARRFPVCPPDGFAVVWEPRAAVLLPEACIGAMLTAASDAGAELRMEEEVLHWSAGDTGVRIRTARATVEAGCLVLAAGAWMTSSLVAAPLPTRVARQTLFWTRPAHPERVGPERLPVWIWETRDGPLYYGFPDLGDGPKLARHHGGRTTTAETIERDVTAEEAGALLEFVSRAIPGVHGPVRDASACMYTNTPDEHFILDRHPTHPQVLIASPCSGHGFKFAPAIGEVMADLAEGRQPGVDITPFRLARFGATDYTDSADYSD